MIENGDGGLMDLFLIPFFRASSAKSNLYILRNLSFGNTILVSRLIKVSAVELARHVDCLSLSL
jgi:hypothetical protein